MKTIETYKGHVITYGCGKFMTLGQMFATLKKAKLEIDKLYKK